MMKTESAFKTTRDLKRAKGLDELDSVAQRSIVLQE